MSYVIGIVYMIYYKLDPKLRYIGSTYLELLERWKNHLKHYKEYLNEKGGEVAIYPYFTELGVENFEIIKIKDYLVYKANERDRKHLSVYEQLWINKNKNICVNKYAAFNPIANLKFALPEASDVSIVIYDMQGREVTTLKNDVMDAGYHTISWNATHHASGIYFVQMNAGTYMKTQKLMLIK